MTKCKALMRNLGVTFSFVFTFLCVWYGIAMAIVGGKMYCEWVMAWNLALLWKIGALAIPMSLGAATLCLYLGADDTANDNYNGPRMA